MVNSSKFKVWLPFKSHTIVKIVIPANCVKTIPKDNHEIVDSFFSGSNKLITNPKNGSNMKYWSISFIDSVILEYKYFTTTIQYGYTNTNSLNFKNKYDIVVNPKNGGGYVDLSMPPSDFIFKRNYLNIGLGIYLDRIF